MSTRTATRTRTRVRVVGALSVPLLLAACGTVTSAAASLEEEADRANAALSSARGVGVVLRFEDTDGALVRALQDAEDGLAPELAELLVGSSLGMHVAATGGRTLAEQPSTDASLEEQLRWYDGAVSVRTGSGELLGYRMVDGDVYVAADTAQVERLAESSDEPVSLDEALEDAPPVLREAYDDLAAGAWLRLPVSELLETVDGLEDDSADSPFPDVPSADALEDLLGAVEPHVRLSDLGSEDGVRRVTVDVDVKAVLEAAMTVLESSLPADELSYGGLDEGGLEGLSGAPLRGTLTLEDGHYRSLEVPLAGLVDLVEDPGQDVPDLGSSSLVLELDDAVQAVDVPSAVSDVDLMSLFEGLLDPFAEGMTPSVDELGEVELTPEEEALFACYDEADSDAAFTACEALDS